MRWLFLSALLAGCTSVAQVPPDDLYPYACNVDGESVVMCWHHEITPCGVNLTDCDRAMKFLCLHDVACVEVDTD